MITGSRQGRGEAISDLAQGQGAAPPRRWPKGAALLLSAAGVALMGFSTARVAGWTISDLVFLATGLVIWLQLLNGRTRILAAASARSSSPPILVGTVVLLTAGTISALGSMEPTASITTTLRFAWLMLVWFWILRAVCRDRHALSALLSAWRMLILVNAGIAVASQIGIVHWTQDNVENRQTGFFGHPNGLGGLLVVGLPIIILGLPNVYARGRERGLLSRAASTAFVLYAISATGSMSAMLAGAAGAVTIWLAPRLLGGARHRRAANPLALMALGSVVLLAGTLLMSSDLAVVERFTRYNEGDTAVQSSVASRGNRNAKVISYFDESLIVGRGFDGHDRTDPDEQEASGAHNMYLRMVFQVGMPGLIGLAAILLFTLHQAVRLTQHLRGDPLHTTALGLLASFVTANTFAMFQPTEFERYYWLPVAFIGCLWALRRAELRRLVRA